MKKLFISYRRKSWAFTDRLARDLGAWIDADIFVDFSHIDETDFESSILKHLRASDAVLVILTEHTFAQDRIHHDGDWVRREIREALTLDKPIVLASDGDVGRYIAMDVPDDIRAIRSKQSHNFYPEFFEAGVERLARFIAKATPIPLRTTPTPVVIAESPKGAVFPEPPPKTPQTLYGEATTYLADGKYDDAIFLLENLLAQGFHPRIGNIQTMVEEAKQLRKAEVHRQEAETAYADLTALVRIAKRSPRMLAEARDGAAAFLHDYPGYGDPLHLWDEVKPKSQAPIVLKMTPEQKYLLDIMLDTRRLPQERAKAGDELAKIGDPRLGVGLDTNGLPLFDWITIPAGDFLSGDVNKWPSKVEKPYWISRYLVTYAQYKAFLEAKDGYHDAQWWKDLHADAVNPDNRPGDRQNWKIANRPAENVCWYEAMAFCKWLTAKLGHEVRLPMKNEWERAACGIDGQIYPWGNEFVNGYANIDETHGDRNIGSHYLQQTTAVGIYPQGASPDWLLDMSGNVWEWTLPENLYRNNSDLTNDSMRELRGGSWGNREYNARTTARISRNPANRYLDVGFRVVATLIS